MSHVVGKRRRCPSRESWAGVGTDRIAGDSSGELDLAPLPGSSQTLLGSLQALPTHMPRRDVNKELRGKGGARRQQEGVKVAGRC